MPVVSSCRRLWCCRLRVFNVERALAWCRTYSGRWIRFTGPTLYVVYTRAMEEQQHKHPLTKRRCTGLGPLASPVASESADKHSSHKATPEIQKSSATEVVLKAFFGGVSFFFPKKNRQNRRESDESLRAPERVTKDYWAFLSCCCSIWAQLVFSHTNSRDAGASPRRRRRCFDPQGLLDPSPCCCLEITGFCQPYSTYGHRHQHAQEERVPFDLVCREQHPTHGAKNERHDGQKPLQESTLGNV